MCKALRQIVPVIIGLLIAGGIYSCGQKSTSTSSGTVTGTVNMPATSIGMTSYHVNLLPLSQAGTLVSGATVRVEGSDNEAKTDDNGNFELKGVKKGQQVVDIEKTDASGRKFKIREVVEVVAGQTVDLGTLELEGTGAIYGTVTLANKSAGNSLGITVAIPDQGLVALTDKNGAYAMAGVEPGTYTVEMSMTGYTDTTVQGVYVTEGAATQVSDATLEPNVSYLQTYGIVNGQVVDSSTNTGISGVIVAVEGTSLATLTDNNGNFSLGLQPGNWTLIASVNEYNIGTASVSVTIGKAVSATIKMSAMSTYSTGAFSGQVVDSSGGKVALATLTTDPFKGQATADNNGNFTLTISPGCYTIKVDKTGYAESSVFKCVDSGQTVGIGTIVLMVSGITSCIGYSCSAPIPSNLSVINGNGQAVLSWSAVTGATDYNVYGSTDSGGPYSAIDTTTTTDYIITKLTNWVTYYFVVTAITNTGESGFSNQVSAVPTTIPAPPTNLGTIVGNGEVALSWSASTGATSYNVYESVTAGGPYTEINSVATLNCVVTGLTNGTVYYFVVTAVNSSGQSGYSHEAGAAPSAYPAGTEFTYTVAPSTDNHPSVAIDASGNVWITNMSGNTVTKLNSSGTVIGTYAAGPAPYSMAIDIFGNVWVVNQLQNTVTELNSTGGLLVTYTVGSMPFGIAIDASGNIWVANNGSNNVTEINASKGIIGTYTVGSLPAGIAIDASDNVWVGNGCDNTVTKLAPTGITIGTYPVAPPSTSGCSNMRVAIDPSGNVWAAWVNIGTATTSGITKLSANGLTIGTYTLTASPESIAIDSSGNVWVIVSSSQIIELNASGVMIGAYSFAFSPSGIAIDSYGNVWTGGVNTNYVAKILRVANGPQYFPYSGPQFPGGGNW